MKVSPMVKNSSRFFQKNDGVTLKKFGLFTGF